LFLINLHCIIKINVKTQKIFFIIISPGDWFPIPFIITHITFACLSDTCLCYINFHTFNLIKVLPFSFALSHSLSLAVRKFSHLYWFFIILYIILFSIIPLFLCKHTFSGGNERFNEFFKTQTHTHSMWASCGQCLYILATSFWFSHIAILNFNEHVIEF
jgi:hypothetical protein